MTLVVPRNVPRIESAQEEAVFHPSWFLDLLSWEMRRLSNEPIDEPVNEPVNEPVDEPLKELARLLKESQSTVILTGAGMSTESGIPDFRSANGLWRQRDPRMLASVEALESNYEEFCEFYQMRIRNLAHCQPHAGHRVLAQWEHRGLIDAVATQNVDGFHQQAGSGRVYELHGSIRRAHCHRCQAEAPMDDFMEGKACSRCGGRLRPDVVLFGEVLPQDAWVAARRAMAGANLVLVMGSSLQVYPVNQLPSMTDGNIAIINAEETAMDARFDVIIHGQIGPTLARLDTLLAE